MASIDAIRYRMHKVANQKEVMRIQTIIQTKNKKAVQPLPQPQGADVLLTAVATPASQPFLSLETKLIESIHLGGNLLNQLNIIRYVVAETSCSNVIITKITDQGKTLRIYCRGTTALENSESYKTDDFPCVTELIKGKIPIVHNDETAHHLALLCQWKILFGYLPDIVVGIPIFCSNGLPAAVVGLAFKNQVPKGFFDKKLTHLKESLESVLLYALVNQGTIDSNDAAVSYRRVLDAIERVEKVIFAHNADIALTQIGTEVASICGCRNLTVFTVDEGDNILRKYHTSFGSSGKHHCPNKRLHLMSEISMTNPDVVALAWVAINRKGMKINNIEDFKEHGIHSKHIHSVGFCIVRSMLLAPVVDYSGEDALVIEIADKDKGFSPKEFEMALLFCQHVGCLLTCSVLLDRRDRNFRRRNIINEMLCSIAFVKNQNVEQCIIHHRKTSKMFKGNFDEFNLCIRCFPEEDIAGIVLEIFYQLDIVKDFKMRRAVLVRFILSVQQGYGKIPYHNWFHAVSVAHYAYLLIKKLELVERNHLSKLEAFALIVSALTHDIDHRGTNNQFQSYTNSDIYKLYACEDSVMERHHLAIALAVLHREDCNILENFSDGDYKYFVELLTWNIIATDISKHLKSREGLFIDSRSASPKQRKMARLSLFMTAADLCDNCKKWDDSLATVKSILQEFFNQGDMEKLLGFTPIPMMDRSVAYIPMIEYKFVKYIVSPVFRFLGQLYEELEPCVRNIARIEDLWALATIVFDKHREKVDPLDILDLPEMREDALMKLDIQEPLEFVKKRKFSFPVPAPPTPTAPQPTPSVVERRRVNSDKAIPILDEEDLDEVDTGEARRGCWAFFKGIMCKKK